MEKLGIKSARFYLSISFLLFLGMERPFVLDAAPWQGFTDQTSSLNTHVYTFGPAFSGNQNYYDGDFADYDGDGLTDRLLISRWGLLRNTGGGLFIPMGELAGVGQPSRPNPTGIHFREDNNNQGINGDDASQWADIDNDGDYDALMGGNGELFSIQKNTNGMFSILYTDNDANALNIVNTDIDRDGDVDIITAHAFCADSPCGGPVDFDLLVNDGAGNFTRQTNSNLSSRGLNIYGSNVTGVVSGDVDTDGDYDLVISVGAQNTVVVYKNNGNGFYTGSPIPSSQAGNSGFAQKLNLGDIDDDGDLDIVAATLDGGHPHVDDAIYINNGQGSFNNESVARFNVNGYQPADYPTNKVRSQNAKLMDVDYDGDLDYVGLYAGGASFPPEGKRLFIFLNDGAGRFTFDTARHLVMNTPTKGLGQDLDVTDLNGDGTYDLWMGLAGEDVHIFINTYTDPSGAPADQPRNLQLVSSSSQGNTLKWQAPAFAANARYYKVYRSQQAGLPLQQRQLIKIIGERHQDDSFCAPITRHTTTAYLGDPDVTLNGAINEIQFIDRTAVPGTQYHYSVVHVGAENTNSQPSPEVSTGGGPQLNQPPTASAGPDAQYDEATLVQLTGSGNDPDGSNNLIYLWTQIQGPTVNLSSASVPNPNFTAPSVAANTILRFRLVVTDEQGASSAPDSVDITVRDVPIASGAPTCSLDIFSPALVNSPVQFNPGNVAGSQPITYSWDFGDGTLATTPSTNPQAGHTYSGPGRYNVFLRVQNTFGNAGCLMTQIVHRPLTPTKPASSSSIIHSGSRIINVNPDNNTVTAIDESNLSKLWEVAVGKKPQTLAAAPNGDIWVVNQDDASLSILNAQSGGLINKVSLPYASRPYGIAFSPNGQAVYVTLQGTGRLLKLGLSGSVQGNSLIGPQARGIAISGDSSRIFVTRFISKGYEGELWEISPQTLSVIRTIKLKFDPGPDQPFSGRGVPNYVNAIRFSPDGLSALVPSKKDNIAAGRFRDGTDLTFETRVRTIVSHIDLTTNQDDLTKRVDVDDRSMAQSLLFSPRGDLTFVGLLGSNSVTILDTNKGNVLGNIPTGLAPQGMAFNADASRLYIHNFLSRSVSVIDTGDLIKGVGLQTSRVAEISTVSNELLAADVLRGKKTFYNASDLRMSRDGYLSCASCHLDGGSDGTVWDFTQGGEGLRNTITLRGRAGAAHGNPHWTANFDEIQDFENDIRNSFGGAGFMSDPDFNQTQDPLGKPKAGLSAALDDLTRYLESLTAVPASPHRNSDGTLTSDGQRGRDIFMSRNCQLCHTAPLFTDKKRHDVGTIQPSSGKGSGQLLAGAGFKTPTLLGVWNTAPYLHNGQADTLEEVLKNPKHGDTAGLSQTEINQLVAYLLQIDDNEAAGINRAPLVNAGPDQNISFPMIAKLSGSVSDDGRPTPPGKTTTRWVQLSGPGNILFADPDALSTQAEFTSAGSYTIRLTADDGSSVSSDEIIINVSGSPALEDGFAKFNPVLNRGSGDNQLSIPYTLSREGPVSLKIYARHGELVRDLFNGVELSGTHSVVWDGKNDEGGKLASGVYFLRMKANDATKTVKLVVVN